MRKFGLGLFLSLPFAVALAGEPVGTVTHLSGVLSVKKPDNSIKLLSARSRVEEGDLIISDEDTFGRIKFDDGGEIVVRPQSRVQVESYRFKPSEPAKDNVVIGLLKGGMRSISGIIGQRSRENFKLKTETATIGIRGTHFGALMCQGDCGHIPTPTGHIPENGLHLDVVQGQIAVSNPAGSQTVGVGQFGYVQSATTPPRLVPPEQGIRVLIPPNMVAKVGTGQTVGKAGSDTECSVR